MPSWRRIVGATFVALVPVAGFSPAEAAGAPVAPAACPTSAPPDASPVAGYTMSAAATGVRAALNSPGLLPTGDAEVGTIVEADIPLARIAVSSGPQVAALASPVYPGDTVAHLGTALQTFGVPIPVPNDPVVAESDFPPAPGHGASEAFSTAGLPVEVATGQASTSAAGGTVTAHVAAADLGGAFTTGASDTATAADVFTSCVDTSARATTSGIVIAGIVDIAGISGYAAVKSGGTTAAAQAVLQVGKVTVAGLAASIERDGVHIAGQGVAAGVVASVEAALQSALAASGTTIRLVDPTTTRNAGAGTADSGGVEVRTKQTLPGIGHPPQGTPPIPLIAEISYGHVQAAVNATAVPAATPVVSTGPGTGSAMSGPLLPSPPPSVALTVEPPPASQALAPPVATPGSQVLAANSAPPPPGRGEPVPIGWMLLGIAASIVAIGPLLGYARWQLLEGRV